MSGNSCVKTLTCSPFSLEEFVVHALTTSTASQGRRTDKGQPENWALHMAEQPPKKPFVQKGTRYAKPGGQSGGPHREDRLRDMTNLICFSLKSLAIPGPSVLRRSLTTSLVKQTVWLADAIRKMRLQQKGRPGLYVSPRERPHQSALIASVQHQCQHLAVGRKQPGTWLLDSGCTTHMTFDKKAFQKLVPLDEEIDILVGNNEVIKATGRGDVPLDTPHGRILLTEVLYVPSLSSNLISYTRLMKKECTLTSSPHGVVIQYR